MRIGILTQYYNSDNYGGNLQAYALTTYLNNQQFNAEQITYDENPENHVQRINFKSKLIQGIKDILRFRKVSYAKKYQANRLKAINSFNKSIPHSDTIYTDKTIQDVNCYDIIIVGSDQVWAPQHLDRAYFLPFEKKAEKRVSYAASISNDRITPDQALKYSERLKTFDDISVREYEGANLLQKMVNQNISVVCDPVFLLDKKEWEETSSKRICSEPYLFCYFLGNSEESRNAAITFAKNKNLKIVTIPFLLGKYRKCDCEFGDIQPQNLSPNDFLSLIKNANYVFTDSFHALSFSIIFQTKFMCFKRNPDDYMISRITHLLRQNKSEERFCSSREKCEIDYINTVVDNDVENKLGDFISESKAFLCSALKL